MHKCMYLCVLCCVLFLTSKLMQKKSDFSMDNSITKIRMGLQKALHQKMLRIEYGKLEDEAFWKKNQRIFHMLDTSESEVGSTLRQIYVFCGLFVTLIISLGMMIKIDISGILLAVVALLSCVSIKKEILFERKCIEEKDALSKKSEYIFEVSNNTRYAKDLRLFNAWDTLKKKIDHLSENLYEIDKESNHLKYKKRYLLEHALYMIYFIVYMVRLLIKYSGQTVDFDIVITAFFLTAAVGNIFFMLMESGVMFGVNMKGIMSFIRFLREEANPKTGGSQAAAGDKKIEWELKNVSYCYPNRIDRALNMINLNIYGKEKIAVVGLNGAGKSTLMKCMTGLYTDFSGSIFYKGESIRYRGCDPAVCVLYQDADIYPFSIGENVSSMDPDMDTGRVYEALEKVGLSKILDSQY